MQVMFEIVIHYFMEKGWPINKHDHLPVLRFEYQGNHGRWFCYARVIEAFDQFVFLSVLPQKTPADKRLAVAEYLTRANFGLNIGNFEMDFEDGEIRFKTSIDVSSQILTSGLIAPLTKASFTNMDDYLPGIEAVIDGTATAQDAYEETLERIQEEDDEYDLIL